MNMKESINFLVGLKEGVNQKTGEVLFDNKENEEVTNAIEKALEIMKKERIRMRKRKNRPSRNGESWSKEEEEKLTDRLFELKKQDMKYNKIINKLAKEHQRTLGAIKSRIEKIAVDETIK